MTSVVARESLVELAAEFAALVDRMQTVDLVAACDEEVVEFWRAIEIQQRRLAAVDVQLIGQVSQRALAGQRGYASTVAFARDVLTVSPGEAKARVQAASRLGPRQVGSGPVQPPEFPATAAAVAAGGISARHAAVITGTVTRLPMDVQEELGDWVETHLLEHARVVDPMVLAWHGRDLAAALDRDGQYREIGYRDRVRDCAFRRGPDGSGVMRVHFTAEAAEYYAVVFDALAGPVTGPDGGRDPRSAGQRRHDALLELAKAGMRTGQLPAAGGVTATVVLTMDAASYATGTGTAVTGHGYTVPADVAKRWAGAEARIIAVLLTKTRRVEAYSAAHRIFTEQQRLALTARDRGCSFPGCDRPPGWCQTHHVTEYQAGGPTCVDNGTLLCGFHHRSFEHLGWTVHMTGGLPWWTPPRWIDPHQTPIRNTAHDHCNL